MFSNGTACVYYYDPADDCKEAVSKFERAKWTVGTTGVAVNSVKWIPTNQGEEECHVITLSDCGTMRLWKYNKEERLANICILNSIIPFRQRCVVAAEGKPLKQ